MSRYDSAKIIKDENGKRKANTVIISAPEVNPVDDVFINVTAPERLDLLAHKFYGDSTLWWVIASANGLGKGTLFTPEGVNLRIPSVKNIQTVIQNNNNER